MRASRISPPPRARHRRVRPRPAAASLRGVLKVQRESGEAMRRVRVPIPTEPAPVFKP
jgi:hypothetical protein